MATYGYILSQSDRINDRCQPYPIRETSEMAQLPDDPSSVAIVPPFFWVNLWYTYKKLWKITIFNGENPL